ncbi:hypothetical protein COV04_03685 [Candidatus Uhrbacteria bacterium CG10_big_fil_rev_8_21_14_0_10_48_11]|uniref:Rod shape-determining protein MreD n=1 Tax=Candidatus Uhrbacteria bacterium CG10_big_fil_rev_8_21_14_0_10_48_11 TaxID=1975037 RepID=A0A2M8LDZ6_9BACT|nr:MAG: hypothetical protein COV04_03685 [Candidatus Uhrbacteria bacterium CG10_big_fil_rev_8_21_14_0_10_48_11]
MERSLTIALVLLTPYFESAVLGMFPSSVASIAFYPLVLLLVFSVFPWWQGAVITLLGGMWHDSVLLAPVLSSLSASFIFALLYGGLLFFLTNRSLIVDVVSGSLAYAAYIGTVLLVSNLMAQLNPAEITYSMSLLNWLLGMLVAALFAGFIRRRPHPHQLSFPFRLL